MFTEVAIDKKMMVVHGSMLLLMLAGGVMQFFYQDFDCDVDNLATALIYYLTLFISNMFVVCIMFKTLSNDKTTVQVKPNTPSHQSSCPSLEAELAPSNQQDNLDSEISVEISNQASASSQQKEFLSQATSLRGKVFANTFEEF